MGEGEEEVDWINFDLYEAFDDASWHLAKFNQMILEMSTENWLKENTIKRVIYSNGLSSGGVLECAAA